MKKKVKVEVINGDWEIKKYRLRQQIESLKEDYGPIVKASIKGLSIGVCFGIGYLGCVVGITRLRAL